MNSSPTGTAHISRSLQLFERPSVATDNMKRFTVAVLSLLAISASAETLPPGYVLQILEPTGGKIVRPKDWFYAEGHRGQAYTWTISREDTSGGRPYTTGVLIQAFVGVHGATGKTAKQFILDFLASKQQQATVLRTCQEREQGLFTRVCLETEEGPHRILYSLFWNGHMDVAVVTIAGTTKEQWKKFAPAFDRMSAFELIDMKRFEK